MMTVTMMIVSAWLGTTLYTWAMHQPRPSSSCRHTAIATMLPPTLPSSRGPV
jgi:hypothetical protein